jgi:hypothetical protein
MSRSTIRRGLWQGLGVQWHACALVCVLLSELVPCSTARAQSIANGPMVTHATQGVGGSDASAVQTTTFGMQVYGVIADGQTGGRIADDVAVPAGESWVVQAVTLYGYVAGTGTGVSPFASVNLRVWDGPPGLGGVVIWGDETTNVLASEAFINVYRVADSNLKDALRPVYALQCVTSDLVLTGGKSYWLDWQYTLAVNGTGRVPLVTILGQPGKLGANARGYDPAIGWTAVRDPSPSGAAQDVPFVVQYTAGSAACYADCDGVGGLNIDDFICFQTYFALGDPFADCDVTGQLNIDDFICYQTFFAIGC